MALIAVGGFQHETNTFAPTRADYRAFEAGAGRPGIQFGAAITAAVAGANLPAAGAIDALHALGHRTVGLAWASATPSAQVTQDAYERIAGEILQRLAAAGPVDGVYLDLHGAMVAEHYEDGEGELLARVRAAVGERIPVVASLDLHANVTRAMLAVADGLVAYRSYPHVDMAETGARAARLLDATLKLGRPMAKASQTLDYLTSIPSQCTFIEPCKGLYQSLARIERQLGLWLSFTPGFPMADIAECGMAVFGYGADAAKVKAGVARLAGEVAAAERDFALELLAPEDAVRRAMQRGAPGAPVVLADTQDNPGAGGNGDTTGLLAAMIRLRAEDAVLGMLIDAPSARAAHALGRGNSARFALGAISGLPGHVPLAGEFTVEALGDGEFTGTGPFYRGIRMQLGAMALLRSREAPGVRVLLASKKCQTADQEMFRHLGVEPKTQRLIALKSSVHFRADFQPIAREVLVVRAPGPALADPADFRWTRLRPGLRLGALGPAFKGTGEQA
jgi:microcystin degradation protein MlrC